MAQTTTPPEGMTNEPFVINREQASSFWLVDSLWSSLAAAQTTGGALTVLDQLMPRRSGPPPHVHPRLHEYFYLLDGEIRFQIGADVKTASAGDFVSVPAGTVHGFAVATETSRVLNLYTPGGFTEQITWLGTPATELRLPTSDEQTPSTDERYNAYLNMSADINTQRWTAPGEAEDLLADERDAFDPR